MQDVVPWWQQETSQFSSRPARLTSVHFAKLLNTVFLSESKAYQCFFFVCFNQHLLYSWYCPSPSSAMNRGGRNARKGLPHSYLAAAGAAAAMANWRMAIAPHAATDSRYLPKCISAEPQQHVQSLFSWCRGSRMRLALFMSCHF